MWDLPGPGLEPVSPAWAGGFLTTAPPGKFQGFILKMRPYLALIMVLETRAFSKCELLCLLF